MIKRRRPPQNVSRCMHTRAHSHSRLGPAAPAHPPPVSPPLAVADEEGADDAGGDAHAAEDGDAHEALLGHLVVDELAQVGGLQVGGFAVEEHVVVAAGLGIAAQLVVAEGEVVQALAPALGRDAEDVGEEADAELLFAAVRGLDETLRGYSQRLFVGRANEGGRGRGGGRTQA